MKDDSFEKLLDFLQGNKENASIICSFIDDLTSEGFEHYVSEYYKKIHGFSTTVNGGFNDKGIDIKGGKIKENGEIEYLIVQCKKWGWGMKGCKDKYFIGENKISEWYGKVGDYRNSWKIHLVYATTKDVTLGAKTFCKGKNIDLITFKELVSINKEMNLNEWIESILISKIPNIEKEKLISKEYRERKGKLLLEKEEIIIETKKEIAIERDRYATFDRTKTYIQNSNKNDIALEKEIYMASKNDYVNFFIKFIRGALACYIIFITISGFINTHTKTDMKKNIQNNEISTVKINTDHSIPNKKKNIQKVRTITSQ